MRRIGIRGVAAFALVCLLFNGVAAPALANDAAAGHFSRAVELYDEGDFATALVEFRRAYQMQPHHRVLYNIGQTEFQLQNYTGALQALRRYLTEGGEEIAPNRRAEVERDIVRLQARVATVHVRANEPNVDLFVDDRKVGVLPIADGVALNAGRRRLRAQKAGFAPDTREIELAGGDDVSVQFQLRGAPSTEAPRDASAEHKAPGHLARTLGYVGVGLGGAALVAGLVIDLGPLGSTVDDFKKASVAGDDRAGALKSRAERERTLALVGYIGGSVLVAGGITLLVLAPPSRPVTATVRADLAGRLVLDGRF